jgi:hypothetical protein
VGRAQPEGHHHAGQFAFHVLVGVGRHGVAAQFLQQRRQHRVGRDADLLAQPLKQMVAPLRQVGQVRRQALRVQAQAQHIDGALQQRRVGHGQQAWHQRVVAHQVPVPVHRQRGPRLMLLRMQVHRLARGSQRRVVQRPFAVHRRIAGRHQQRVALAQRHGEPLGQAQHHFTAGHRAAGFHEAQVPGGDAGLLRQIELDRRRCWRQWRRCSPKRAGRAHGRDGGPRAAMTARVMGRMARPARPFLYAVALWFRPHFSPEREHS